MNSDRNEALSKAMPLLGPNFLGIGVPKGATTWLHVLLQSHPDVWVPDIREVHFFSRDNYFARGLDWYLKLFPDGGPLQSFKAIGEITPTYLYCTDHRIKFVSEELPSVKKLICVVRNPIDRAWSHYWFFRRLGKIGAEVSFEDFLDDRAISVERGLYALHLRNWLKYFDRDQLLILVFEEIFQDIGEAKKQIAEFLEIDAKKFPELAGTGKINERFMPRFPRAYALAVRLAKKARDWNFYGIDDSVKKLGLKKLFGRRKDAVRVKQMNESTRSKLRATFAGDVRELEGIMGRQIEMWQTDFGLSVNAKEKI